MTEAGGEPPQDRPKLSVVAPIYNEQGAVRELVERIVAAVGGTGLSYEVIVADDCSDDDSAAILVELQAEETVGEHLRVERLPRNRGQFQATVYGLAASRGDSVVVLDGDLQDPPELIVELVAAMDAAADGVDVVYATKDRRDDPAWFLAGRAVFAATQAALSDASIPAGAGSYVIISRDLAQRAARVRLEDANLAAVLAALGASATTIPYDKAARYDSSSRVGPWGLLREAVGSMMLTGALARLLRWLWMAASISLGVLWAVGCLSCCSWLQTALLVIIALGVGVEGGVRNKVRNALAEAR